MTQTEVREQVWAYILENFLYMRPDFRVRSDDSLLRNGVFDSLGVMEVIGFLEEAYGIQVEPQEITEANFDALDAIAAFVVAKLAGAPALEGQPAA